jgi:hypothetical protein
MGLRPPLPDGFRRRKDMTRFFIAFIAIFLGAGLGYLVSQHGGDIKISLLIGCIATSAIQLIFNKAL